MLIQQGDVVYCNGEGDDLFLVQETYPDSSPTLALLYNLTCASQYCGYESLNALEKLSEEQRKTEVSNLLQRHIYAKDNLTVAISYLKAL